MFQHGRNANRLATLLLIVSVMVVSVSANAQPKGASRGRVEAPKKRWYQLWRRTPRATHTLAPQTTSQRHLTTPAQKAKTSRTVTKSNAGKGHERLTLRQTWGRLRDEFQLYRGERLERLASRLVVGRSTHDPKLTIGQNLEAAVSHYNATHAPADHLVGAWKEIAGRRVYTVTVELAKGKATRSALRALFKRVERQTIEMNYKAATSKNPTGHVAVRVGDGATYDLTGANAASKLPRFLASMLRRIKGTTEMSFGRRRSLRRFMESRKDWSHKSASVFYGFLFSASKGDQVATERRYKGRLSLRGGEKPAAEDPQPMTKFAMSGGDAQKGIYSCAQVLTEKVPFINERGMSRTVSAKKMVSDAAHSKQLDGIIIYKMPSMDKKTLETKSPW